jgi:hypothetical protein
MRDGTEEAHVIPISRIGTSGSIMALNWRTVQRVRTATDIKPQKKADGYYTTGQAVFRKSAVMASVSKP